MVHKVLTVVWVRKVLRVLKVLRVPKYEIFR
jgi:hypothetical protein